MRRVHILHENADWAAPLRTELERRAVPFVEWFLDQGTLDLTVAPPDGVFFNRMSASSHTRGHPFAPEYTAAVLSWLEAHERRVVNGTRALQLETNKVSQYMAFRAHGIRTPRTVAAVGKEAVVAAADRFDGPFITKHIRVIKKVNFLGF